MAEPQTSAPAHPRGVVHVRRGHTECFTVVGNHLAQHRELSLMAIGLAVHIQSLPEGTRVDIKTLAARFPEGETRIASALRELEEHGYLSRTRLQLPGGRVATRTVSYDRPGAQPQTQSQTQPQMQPQMQPATRPVQPARPAPEAVPEPARHPQAEALLAELPQFDARLRLSERDVRRLAPAVAVWLDRGVSADAVRRALTEGLPPVTRHPAGLLAHRLAALPPRRAAPPRPDPLQNCDGCDKAYRTPEPGGRCAECRRNARLETAA